MKLITFAIPSYNSEAYLHHAVDTILTGGEDVEIIIINDGSKDGTAAIADAYVEKYPTIVKAVHKPNGGHGSGVNWVWWKPLVCTTKSWIPMTGLMKRPCGS